MQDFVWQETGLADRLEATLADPSEENFRRLRYRLSWSGVLAPSPPAYRAALRALRDLAEAG